MKTQLVVSLVVLSSLMFGCESMTGRASADQDKLATAAKPVMQIGRGLTPDLEQRESSVSDKVQSKQSAYAACYRSALKNGNLPRTDGLFYFSVDPSGKFGELSGETAADTGDKTTYADLRGCIQNILAGLSVEPYPQKLTYRFRVFFGQRVD